MGSGITPGDTHLGKPVRAFPERIAEGGRPTLKVGGIFGGGGWLKYKKTEERVCPAFTVSLSGEPVTTAADLILQLPQEST